MSEAAEGMSFEDAIASVQKAASQRQAPPTEVPAQTGSAESREGSPPQAANPEPVPAPAPTAPPVETAPASSDQGKPQEGSPVDPAIKRLLDREAQLQEREKAVATYEAAKRQFKHDPVRAIKALVPDASLGDIAKALWVEELGDLAPPEAKQEREVRGVRSEVEELRAQVAEDRRRLEEEQARQQGEFALNQYVGALRAAVSTVESTKYPLVASFQKKHSDGVVDEMLAIAQSHAQSTGEIPTPAQTLERLEAYLGRYQVADVPPVPAAPKVETQPAPSQSLRNSHTQVQPNLSAPDELNDEYLRAQALKAVREARARRQG